MRVCTLHSCYFRAALVRILPLDGAAVDVNDRVEVFAETSKYLLDCLFNTW